MSELAQDQTDATLRLLIEDGGVDEPRRSWLDSSLRQRLVEARDAHPDVILDEGLFVPYVLSRLPEDAGPTEFDALHMGDLYLACACVLGVPRALEFFERDVLERVRTKVARMLADDDDVADVMQRVRTHLLLDDEQSGPQLAAYAGRGTLLNWTKVVAVRRVLMDQRRANPEQADNDLLEQAAALDAAPELALMQQRYRHAFRDAFGDAVRSLSAEERTLLRHHVIDRLSIDGIASLLGVHRATAARRLVKIRAELRTRTLDRLRRDLEISPNEVDSIVRLVRSQLEVSLRGLLTP